MQTLALLAAAGELAQLAEGGKLPTFDDNHIIEPKFDGWRIIAHVKSDGVDFYARSGNLYNGKLPIVEAELLARFPTDTWLDGEAVSLDYNPDGSVTDKWNTVQSVLTKHGGHAAADKVTYMVFDLLAHRGIDARPLSLAKRRGLLEKIFGAQSFESIRLTPQLEATEENAMALVQQGFEGCIVKALAKPYGSGKRGAGWIKMKAKGTVEAVVMGFKDGKNGFAGMVGAIIFGQHNDDGELVERGACSGFDMRTRMKLTKDRDKYIGRVIEVQHMGVMKGGLRHPQFKRWRPDRSPESVLIHNG